MDLPIQPKPSNHHKPRIRLINDPASFYSVLMPRFDAKPMGDWVVQLVVRDYVLVANLPTLKHAIGAAVEYAKFKEIRFGGAQ